MHTVVPIESIQVLKRQRGETPEAHILELAREIQETELLHAPVINSASELIGGFCRLSAIKRIAVPYKYAGTSVQPGFIPVIVSDQADKRILFRLELMENLRRKALTPMDEAKAVKELHSMFQAEHGPTWTKAQTGQALDAMQGTDPRTKAEVRNPRVAERDVSDSILLASFENDPDIIKAGTKKEAIKMAKKKLETQLMSSLGDLAQINKSNDLQVIEGDCLAILPTLPKGTFAGIVCDPPYGMGADRFGEQTSAEGHEYADDTLEVALGILAMGFTLCQPDAHLYLFCDIRHFEELSAAARTIGWLPFATPLIWHKPGQGHAPQPGFFGRRYETLLFAQKGNRKLSRSHSDVFEFAGVKDKVHAAQKPEELIAELIGLSIFPGEHVLDPCAGCGTIFRAAKAKGVKATGIEMEKKWADICKGVILELK